MACVIPLAHSTSLHAWPAFRPVAAHDVPGARRYGLDTSQFGYDPAAAEAGAPPPPPLIPREDGRAAQARCAVM